MQPAAINYKKAKQLRDAGIGMMVCGYAVAVGIGVPLIVTAHDKYEEPIIEQVDAAIAMWTIGGAMFVSSIPMLAVGQVRMNKAKNQTLAFSLNASSNGLGLGMTF